MIKLKTLQHKLTEFVKARPEAWLLLYWPIHTVIYMVLNKLTPYMNYHVIYSPTDDKIPFIEYFVLPYDLWFFYIAATLLYFLWKNKRDYLRTSFMLISGMAISTLICFIYPSMHELRPVVFARENICTALVKALYETDNPAVIFPSMHVLISLLLAISLWTAECMKGKTAVRIAGTVLSVLICMATVFIKQHSILDVYFALVMVIPICIVTYCFSRKARRRSKDAVISR